MSDLIDELLRDGSIGDEQTCVACVYVESRWSKATACLLAFASQSEKAVSDGLAVGIGLGLGLAKMTKHQQACILQKMCPAHKQCVLESIPLVYGG